MSAGPDPRRRPSRVLIIDDDWTTRETFTEMLASEGHRVRAAGSVEAGLAEASAEIPDVLLLDLHMPIAGGLECLRRIRSMPQWSAIPAAILTGDYFLDEEVARELRLLGAHIHFKPVWEDDLRRIVAELLPVRTTTLR